MNNISESKDLPNFFYPNARSFKSVKLLLDEADGAAEDEGRVEFQKQLRGRALKAKELNAAGKEICFAMLDTEEPGVDYLTERIPALIICAAFVIAGALGGFLPQAIVVTVLILVGSFFSNGVDSEHLTSEGKRLVCQLEKAIDSICSSMKQHKTNEERQEYLHTLLYMLEGARKEINDDIRHRANN